MNRFSRFIVAASTALAATTGLQAEETVVVGGTGATCLEDPACINRFHPAIPMAATAKPGQTIHFQTRDAADILGTVANQPSSRPVNPPIEFGRIHPVTGPVHIEGAKTGDTLAVTITNIKPGDYAWTSAGSFGFASDLTPGEILVMWDLTEEYATSPDLPGVKIPNAGFPGIMATLPSPDDLLKILSRENALAKAGGIVSLPDNNFAKPAALCGPESGASDACLRTIPPREHGGNIDIRYFKKGVTVYLPCRVDGCGLGIGDLHYAQGDGEVGGAAIEMSADVWVTTRIIKAGEGPNMRHGPHYSGPATLLNIPSGEFYAVTGFPFKEEGSIPPEMAYLESGKVAPLTNLSRDINLAARNALDGILDYIVNEYGYTRQQAYVIASVAVDMRIGQLVDAPNVGVTALLPLDIFEGK